MRAAISLFITGLVLGSLAVNTQASGTQVSNAGSQQLMSAKNNTNMPPRRGYRGSGRKQFLMQSVESTNPTV